MTRPTRDSGASCGYRVEREGDPWERGKERGGVGLRGSGGADWRILVYRQDRNRCGGEWTEAETET